MSTVKAIIAGAFLMASAFLLAQGGFPTAKAFNEAQAFAGGPYLLMQHSNTTANVGVFRINTSTGDVSYCYLSLGNDLVCTRSVR
ncbi:MAG: hypothetical protein FWF24_07760 [Alphaproteobacteria bacterium]|nr:hypothetical protein [Alphaproteobacteria bacterium]